MMDEQQRYCTNCGKPVGADDWAQCGSTRVWTCGARECEKEFQYAEEEECERRIDEIRQEYR